MYLLYIIGHYMYWGHNNSPHMTYLPDWWPVGERIRWFACRSWHYVHHETLCLYPVFSALPRRSKVDIILGGLPYPWGHWLTWVEAFKPLMARIVQQFDISYPPGAKNVEPFIRGVTVPNRPVRVQFVDRKWVRFSCRHVHLALQHLLDRRCSISHI